ncbi:MAG: hypothetical protein KA712_09390 [Myxococcales bacterium]|nr:hypothetical protein [Myxococcales bacterium]
MPAAPNRLDLLRGFIAQRPSDPFPRYALAQELKNGGDLNAAWDAYSDLMAQHPAYVPAYFHAGGVLVALGRRDEARTVFERGVALCDQVGDGKTRAELLGALAELG